MAESALSRSLVPLMREFDKWSASGHRAYFWWRDDDAACATPQLTKLLDVAAQCGITVAIAVVPGKADRSLVNALTSSRCCVWQHGWTHAWHARGEFGEGRPTEALIADALRGQATLDDLFGRSGWQRIFVPPHHSIELSFKSLLPILGYDGVSLGELGDGYRPTPVIASVPEVNADVDVVDWADAAFIGIDALVQSIVRQLEARRIGFIPRHHPIGLLTHHLIHDDSVWAAVTEILETVRGHAAGQLVDAERIFPQRLDSVSEPTPALVPGAVSVVITSCGRLELLERTLDSFFRHNTFPVSKVVVIEDGAAAFSPELKARYAGQPMIWAGTGDRVGQVRAIDLAYRVVDTEYIFHCEDDWEFYRPGFIEDSIKILRCYPQVLQAWIRWFPEHNPYPRLSHEFDAEGVKFVLVAPGIDKHRKWIWHGFTFNPGLRRTRDYSQIGSYAAFDPLAEKLAADVERILGTHYRGLGFHGAIVAGDASGGYVDHIGEGRHVVEPIQHLFAPMSFRQHLKDLIPSFVRAVKWRLDRL